MSELGINENTLGAVITPRAKRGGRQSRPPVNGRDIPHRASLGMAFIGIGASIVAALSTIYGFSWFVAQWNLYPNPVPALISWILLIMALVGGFVISRLTGERLPDWIFAIFVSFLACAAALDVLSIWSLNDIGRYATAALSAGMVLLVVVTLRGSLEILVADAVLGVGLLASVAVNSDFGTGNIAPQITTVAYAVIPAALGVLVVHGFRRMVQVELDRVLIQSTVSAPRFAVGMLASEELARLDLAAEELLDSVSTGRTPLPLRPRTASLAASLATELRLHLIEGRRETWLHHAVSESEMLGKTVSLVDKGSLAGLLDPTQRDGLLEAIWVLVSERSKPSETRTIEVQVGPIAHSVDTGFGVKLAVPIIMTTRGTPRNRVDPSTWEALRRVGRYSDSTRDASVRIEIECLVDNPADV